MVISSFRAYPLACDHCLAVAFYEFSGKIIFGKKTCWFDIEYACPFAHTTSFSFTGCWQILDSIMSNSKGSSNMRSVMYSGKHALLPPKSPFPSLSPSASYADYVPNPPAATKAVQRPREGSVRHQRTSSESFLMDEQPPWLDDLLNEPETPVRKGGHRRSSSDSFAYTDVASLNNLDYFVQGDNKLRDMVPSAGWRSQDFDRQASLCNETKYVKHKNNPRGSPGHASNGLPSASNNVSTQSSGSSCVPLEVDWAPATLSEKQDVAEARLNDSLGSSERKENTRAKSSSFDTDAKRAKQYVVSPSLCFS